MLLSVDCYWHDNPARHQVIVICEYNATQLANPIITGESGKASSFVWVTVDTQGPHQDDPARHTRALTFTLYDQPVLLPIRDGVEVRAPPLNS